MASVAFRPRADVVEIPRGLSLSNVRGEAILSLVEERKGSPMFLRRFERRSGRGRRTYWALVESLRTGRGSRLRDFGDVWMALGLWRLLGLDTLLDSLTSSGREEVPWPVVAAILSIAPFCQPQSELHIESTWYRGTALEDLLGVPVDKVHTDRLYGGLEGRAGSENTGALHPAAARASTAVGSPGSPRATSTVFRRLRSMTQDASSDVVPRDNCFNNPWDVRCAANHPFFGTLPAVPSAHQPSHFIRYEF
jgi:hypothetical protein